MTNMLRKHAVFSLPMVWLLTSALAPPLRAAAPTVDACTLVTVAEVEQIVGKLKLPPRLVRDEHTLRCDYVLEQPGEAMEIWVFPGEALERARQHAQGQAVPLTGFGSGAFLHRDTALGYLDLWLKKGDIVLQVTLKAISGDEQKVKAIAQQVLGRL